MMGLAIKQKVKFFVKSHLPRGANLGPPIVQLFLNDGRNTHLGLINFPTFLAPDETGEYVYRLCIYDADGRKLGEKQIELSRFGSIEVNLADVFAFSLPSYGMVAVRIEPRNSLYFGDRHLGRIRSNFFTLYTGPKMDSLGLIHPQTSLDAPCDPTRSWMSNLQLDPRCVRKIEVFQVNPSRQALESEVILQGSDGHLLANAKELVPAHGTRRAMFDMEPLEKFCESFSVGLRGLAAANGKPILFMHFRDGSFTCCHG